jgi:arginase family enzyme
MSTPVYIIGSHEGKLLLADEKFSRFWRTELAVEPPAGGPTVLVGVPLRAAEPHFQYTDHTELGRQDLVLVGIPTAGGSMRSDSAVAAFPDSLRAASRRYPAYAMVDEPGCSGLYDLDEQRALFKGLIWRDLGDLAADAGPEALARAVTRLGGWAVGHDVRMLAIGGDHEITYTIVRSLARSIARPLIVVDLDAHNDCGVNVHPEERIHHANFVRHLLDSDQIIGIVQIGVRGIRSPGQVFSHPKLIQIPPSARNEHDLLAAIDQLRAIAPDAAGYLTIDLDVLDPREFPWVDFPAPGGLSMRSLVSLVQALFRSQLPVLGADLVEGCGGGQVERNDYDVPVRVLAHVMDGLLLQRRRDAR